MSKKASPIDKLKAFFDAHRKGCIIGGAIALFLIIGGISAAVSPVETDKGDESSSGQNDAQDYTGKDAREAYNELIANGYTVKFVFDRDNNGGFTEEKFQEYVDTMFNSESYKDSPLLVTKQNKTGKSVTLYVDNEASINSKKEQAEKDAKLEEKLSINSAKTACEKYGERNYYNFKMHSIVGNIAEKAYDENTWFLKYYVDANGQENLNMECYVTGTTDNPQVSKFLVY